MDRAWQAVYAMAILFGCLAGAFFGWPGARAGIIDATCTGVRACAENGCADPGVEDGTTNPVACKLTSNSFLVCEGFSGRCNPHKSNVKCAGVSYPAGSGCAGMPTGTTCYAFYWSCQ